MVFILLILRASVSMYINPATISIQTCAPIVRYIRSRLSDNQQYMYKDYTP